MNQVQLIIYPSNHLTSGHTIDVNFANDAIPVTYSIGDIRTLNEKSAPFSKTINIPGTKEVNILFAHIFDVGVECDFNPNLKILCQILQNDSCILTGYLQLRQINIDNKFNIINYETVVYSNADNLIKNLSGVELQDLDFTSYNHIYTASTIDGSWTATTDNGGYVYPYIDLGKNWSFQSISNFNGSVQYTDMRPAMFLKNIVKSIFDYAGYTFTSSLFDSEIFGHVVMPLLNFKLTPEEVELNKYKASTTGWTSLLTVGNQIIDTIIFEDDSLQGFDYSGLYNTTTGQYTFQRNLRCSMTFNISMNILPQALYGVALTVIRAGTLNPVYLYSTPIDIATGSVSIQMTTPEFDFNAGDIIYVPVVRLSNSTLTVNAGSYVQLNVTDKILLGSNIDMASIMPDNIKAVDFLSSVFKTFNVYFEDDKINSKNIILETREEFYRGGEIVDWSNKLDTNRPFEITVLPELQAKNILLSWTQDLDYFNKLYFEKNDEIYGQHEILVDNDFLKETSKTNIQPLFSPTPLAKIANSNNIIIPKIFKANDAGLASEINAKPRLLMWGGTQICDHHKYGELLPGTGIPGISGTYPYAGSLYPDVQNATFDLNFAPPKSILFTVSGTNGFNQFQYCSNNLYSEYWQTTIEEITSPQSRLITAFFRLKPSDIANLSFRNTIQVNGINYKLNKIIDYNALSNESTKVELIKSITIVPTSTQHRTFDVATEILPEEQRISLGRNNSISDQNNIVAGDYNQIHSNSEGNLILGDNNIIGNYSQGTLVSGGYNTGNTKQGLILGGSGNTIDWTNINSAIISSTNSRISSTGRTNSMILGGESNILVSPSVNNIIIGGTGNSISSGLTNVQLIGGNNYTASTSNMVYVPNITVFDVASGGTFMVTSDNDGKLFYQDIPSVSGSSSSSTGSTSGLTLGSGTSIVYLGSSANTIYFKSLSGGNFTQLRNSTDNQVIIIDHTLFVRGASGNKSFVLSGASDTATGNYSFSLGRSNVNSGSYSSVVNGRSNNVETNYSSIVNGSNSRIRSGNHNFIGAGYQNIISGATTGHNVISGGRVGRIYNSTYSNIGGGASHAIRQASHSVIAGGQANAISGATAISRSFIGGGLSHRIYGSNAVIAGGYQNKVFNSNGVIVGGTTNISRGGAIVSGQNNINAGANTWSFIGAGTSNVISTSANGAGIVAGSANSATSQNAFIGAGVSNTAGFRSGVVAGDTNSAAVLRTFVGAGSGNSIINTAYNSAIIGGLNNAIYSNCRYGFIGSGTQNKLTRSNSVIVGGKQNSNKSIYAIIVGGSGNTLSDYTSAYSFIGVGQSCSITANFSAILSGRKNTIASNSHYGLILNGSGNTISSSSGLFNSILGGHNIQITASSLSRITTLGVEHYSPGESQATYVPKLFILSATSANSATQIVVREDSTGKVFLRSGTALVMEWGGVTNASTTPGCIWTEMPRNKTTWLHSTNATLTDDATKIADLNGYNECRLFTCMQVAGALDTTLIAVEYSTDNVNWSTLVSLTIANTTGVKDSGYVSIPSGAKEFVYLRMVGENGDAIVSPQFAPPTLLLK